MASFWNSAPYGKLPYLGYSGNSSPELHPQRSANGHHLGCYPHSPRNVYQNQSPEQEQVTPNIGYTERAGLQSLQPPAMALTQNMGPHQLRTYQRSADGSYPQQINQHPADIQGIDVRQVGHEINEVCSKLHLIAPISIKAVELFRRVQRHGHLHTENMTAYIAASIFMACRDQKKSVILGNITSLLKADFVQGLAALGKVESYQSAREIAFEEAQVRVLKGFSANTPNGIGFCVIKGPQGLQFLIEPLYSTQDHELQHMFTYPPEMWARFNLPSGPDGKSEAFCLLSRDKLMNLSNRRITCWAWTSEKYVSLELIATGKKKQPCRIPINEEHKLKISKGFEVPLKAKDADPKCEERDCEIVSTASQDDKVGPNNHDKEPVKATEDPQPDQASHEADDEWELVEAGQGHSAGNAKDKGANVAKIAKNKGGWTGAWSLWLR